MTMTPKLTPTEADREMAEGWSLLCTLDLTPSMRSALLRAEPRGRNTRTGGPAYWVARTRHWLVERALVERGLIMPNHLQLTEKGEIARAAIRKGSPK